MTLLQTLQKLNGQENSKNQIHVVLKSIYLKHTFLQEKKLANPEYSLFTKSNAKFWFLTLLASVFRVQATDTYISIVHCKDHCFLQQNVQWFRPNMLMVLVVSDIRARHPTPGQTPSAPLYKDVLLALHKARHTGHSTSLQFFTLGYLADSAVRLEKISDSQGKQPYKHTASETQTHGH